MVRLGKVPAAIEWLIGALSADVDVVDPSPVSMWDENTLGPLDQWLLLPRSWAVRLGHRGGRAGGLLIPILALLPTLGAVIRGVNGGGHVRSYFAAVMAAGCLVTGWGYHACRLEGAGSLLSISCMTWREMDTVVVACSLTFVGSAIVGLVGGWLASLVAVVLPARAIHLSMTNGSFYQIAALVMWLTPTIFANCLLDRWWGGTTNISISTVLAPELRTGPAPFLGVVLPWLAALVAWVLPCFGGHAYYWLSIWACHAALGVALFGVSYQVLMGATPPPNGVYRKTRAHEIKQKQETAAVAASDGGDKDEKVAPKRKTTVAPYGKKLLISGWAKKKLTAQLQAFVPGSLPEGVTFTKARVESVGCSVAPVPGSKDGSDSVEWAASYELKVDLDLAVAYKGIKPTAALCYFKLTHASDLDALPMDVDLRVPTTTKVGQGITPVDSAAYKAAQQLLTEAAMNVRTAMGSVVPALEDGMLERVHA